MRQFSKRCASEARELAAQQIVVAHQEKAIWLSAPVCFAKGAVSALFWAGSTRMASAQQVGHVDDALSDFDQLQPLVHRGLAQQRVSLAFRQALALHQDAFGAVDGLAV